MSLRDLLHLFLVVTFVLHGLAFATLGVRRRKVYYFFLTGTFIFLTTLYFVKFKGWDLRVPGIDWPANWLLRAGAALSTLTYLWLLNREEGSWLWRLTHRGGA